MTDTDRNAALPAPCECETCREARFQAGERVMLRMVTCPLCGNKRCPRATDHRLACTNSNEPGQWGSNYGTPVGVLGRQEASGGAVPVGWKLVPIEPTERMIAVYADLGPFKDIEDAAEGAWVAMLAAAPVAPAPSEPAARSDVHLARQVAEAIEIVGMQCADTGKCHHECTPNEGCARAGRLNCVPLSLAAPWLNDDWTPRGSDAQPVDERALLREWVSIVDRARTTPGSRDKIIGECDALIDRTEAALAQSPVSREAVIAGDRTTHWYACPHCSKPIDPPPPQEAAGKADGRDAERWRWMRDHSSSDEADMLMASPPEEWDALADEAIAAAPEPRQ